MKSLEWMKQNRREFVGTLLGGAVSLSFAQNVAAPITSTKLTDNIFLISGAGSNVLLVNAPDGLLMVDGGSAQRSADLMSFIAAQNPGKRVQVSFNTHWHTDHTGSNDSLGKGGAKIIAHENTKLWMGTEIVVQWEHKTYAPRPKEARPNETIYTTGKLTFGKEEIQYGQLGQAHTDGDIYVFLPNSNILVTGDAFTVGSYPITDWSTGGWTGGLAPAARTLLGLANAQTKIIPGNGPVQTRADLQAYSDMVTEMHSQLVALMKKGMNTKAMVDAKPSRQFDAKWGDPQFFIENAYPGLWNHVRELGGSPAIL